MHAFAFPTGANGATGHEADVAIDQLYASAPGKAPAPQPCPEALFSITLRGRLDGIETLLTVRGMTSEEFTKHLTSVRGLLDPVPAKVSPQGQPQGQGEGWCAKHGAALHLNHGKDGRTWLSHKTPDGWCKGKGN